MKKVIKFLFFLILCGCLGFEVYFYYHRDLFNKEENKTEEVTETEEIVKLSEEEKKKMIVDPSTPYKFNGITIKNTKISDNYNYDQIAGLKNTEVLEKVNNKIKEKFKQVKDKYDSASTKIVGNFSNILSVEFYNYTDINKADSTLLVDTLNVNLVDGNEVTLDDLFVNKNSVKYGLFKMIADSFEPIVLYTDYNSQDIIDNAASDAMTMQRNWKYDNDGDSLMLAVSNQINKGNYMFSITNKAIKLTVFNVYSSTISKEDNPKKCVNFNSTLKKCVDEQSYYFGLALSDLADDLILFDRYTGDDLYENEQRVIDTKFGKTAEDCLLMVDNDDYYWVLAYEDWQEMEGTVYHLEEQIKSVNTGYSFYKTRCYDNVCTTFQYEIPKDEFESKKNIIKESLDLDDFFVSILSDYYKDSFEYVINGYSLYDYLGGLSTSEGKLSDLYGDKLQNAIVVVNNNDSKIKELLSNKLVVYLTCNSKELNECSVTVVDNS